MLFVLCTILQHFLHVLRVVRFYFGATFCLRVLSVFAVFAAVFARVFFFIEVIFFCIQFWCVMRVCVLCCVSARLCSVHACVSNVYVEHVEGCWVLLSVCVCFSCYGGGFRYVV